MDINEVTEGISVSGHIRSEDAALAAHFRTVINNRPDDEEPGQPIQTRRCDPFSDAISEEPGPVLAFCRTGNRSTMIWTLSQAGMRGVGRAAAEAGYDLQSLRSGLEQQARAL